jgi:hypothetical protein
VNARLGKGASQRLDRERAVEQMTWCPGQPEIIANRLVVDGGFIERPGVRTYNLYRPPVIEEGDPDEAITWLRFIEYLYPENADHIIKWLAQRAQRPGEKINHAIVLGGVQGIGKDTLLAPLKYAVGDWNFTDIGPLALIGRFNGFVKSVVLRINEARDLGEINRFAFYEHLKVHTASPPEVIRCDEKNLREHPVFNVTGILITTNHRTDGIYLPPDDRRHHVAWSDRPEGGFETSEWGPGGKSDLWKFYANGGLRHVAALLKGYDISEFNSKAPPPKTPAFYEIVNANRAPEDNEFADALDALGNPKAVTLAMIANK